LREYLPVDIQDMLSVSVVRLLHLIIMMGLSLIEAQDAHKIKLVHCTNTSTGGNLQWEYNGMAFLIHWSSKLSMYATGSETQPDPSAVMASDSVGMESAQWIIDVKSLQLRAFRATGDRCLQLNSTGTGVEVGICATGKIPPVQQFFVPNHSTMKPGLLRSVTNQCLVPVGV
jgi:hypothetical protein